MIKTQMKGLPAYQFHLLQKHSDQVRHAVFTRAGGVSKGQFASLNVRFGIGDRAEDVIDNRKQIVVSLKDNANAWLALISANQTHSKNVMVIDSASEFGDPRNGVGNGVVDDVEAQRDIEAHGEVDDVDAFVTNLRNVALMVQVADCQAILMCAPSKGVIAAAHAGWRGLVQDISGEVINVMQERFGVSPEEILVGISPSLGPCCSFFSNPSKELPADFGPYVDPKNRVDLWSYSVDQLKSHGILPNHIELARVCTQCENGRVSAEERLSGEQKNVSHFYSFRGDQGITGRFGVVIAI